MPSELVFKRITTDHIPQFIVLRLEFLQSIKCAVDETLQQQLSASIEEFCKEALPTGQLVGWMAWDGDIAVSVGIMAVYKRLGQFTSPDGLIAYVQNMYTLEAYRGRGAGSTILRYMTDYAKENNISRLELHASPLGESVYRKQGFEEHNEPFLMLKLQ